MESASTGAGTKEPTKTEGDSTAGRLRMNYALYPITSDEATTCRAILEQERGATLLIMPTHHISPQGDMMGFRYECSAHSTGDVLPVVRTMFFGHTSVECLDDDAAIMRLMSDPEGNKQRMRTFLQRLQSNDMPADLDCIPDNATALTSTGVLQATDLRSVDCKPWRPEPPETIGFYHAYIRGYNRDVRTHKLFAVCSGGCAKASDQFCNLMIDVGGRWTAGEVTDSEEAWWLRKACQRARNRLIKMLADEFGVRVPCVEDVLAHPLAGVSEDPSGGTPRSSGRQGPPPILMAVPTTDTVEHDLARGDAQTVMVMNSAIDTTKVTNGILCRMHPSEGYWLFRGAPRGTGVHGAMFGNHRVCGTFPTRSPTVTARHPNAVPAQDRAYVVRAEGGQPQGRVFMCFDEAFFKNLELMQWNRDNGHVELIPIVVGVT
jgi:hypothetical protein